MEIDRQNTILRYERAIQDNYQQLQILYTDDSNYKIQLERLQAISQQRELQEDELAMREELNMRVDELKERIVTCSDALKYSQDHHSKITSNKF